jgi:CHAD domain-containing protein
MIRTMSLLDKLEFQLRRTLKAPDADQVHDLRVATRRFSQALVVFESSFRGAKSIRRELKTVMGYAGDVRDFDIALKFLSKGAEDVDPAIAEKIARKRGKSETKLTRALQRIVSRKAFVKWRAKLASPKEIETGEHPAIAVLHAVERFFDRGDRACSSDSPKRLHRLRIATKKLRYTLELEGRPAAQVRKHGPIEQLQSDLGHIHDFDSVRELLSKYRGVKELLGPAEKKQRIRIDEFRALWKKEFDGKVNRGRWLQRAKLVEKAIAPPKAQAATKAAG